MLLNVRLIMDQVCAGGLSDPDSGSNGN